MIPGAICPPRKRKPTPGAPFGRPFRGGDCSECGKPIWCKRKIQAEKQETCSSKCSHVRYKRIAKEHRQALGPPPKRACVICGTLWQPVNRKVRRTTCSVKCERELHGRQNKANAKERRNGEPLPDEIAAVAAKIRMERELSKMDA